MKKIFIGFLLIFLDFNLNLGNSQIGLIPDFIGYIVMLNGLTEMADESAYFTKVKPYTTAMAIYTCILYIINALGVSMALGIFAYILGILSTIISLYISYQIIRGIQEMEDQYNVFLNGTTLKTTWQFLAVFSLVVYITLIIPFVAIISLIIGFIVAICFLVAFSKSKNLYYEMKNQLN